MFRSKFLPMVLGTAVALGAAGCALANTEHDEHSREMAAALAAKISPVQAIAKAEKQSGGRAVKIDIDRKEGAYVYDVKTVSKDKVESVLVDPDSGKIFRSHERGWLSKILDDEDSDEIASLTSSPTTLTAAITTAQQNVGGKAFEARFDDEHDHLRIKVKVAKDATVHRVTIDGTDGKIVSNTTGEHGHFDWD